ncbi:MAG: histidinol-phosphatase HisJ family protein [Lachnospiraceae bacterium]|nr:histidinol-phosphatase HisJ family protein [Lachnospiraceae bacterium]
MIVTDLHLHTKFSSDGISEMADMIASARNKGLKTICFTEHMDYDTNFPDGTFVVDTDAYLKRYHELVADGYAIKDGANLRPDRNRDLQPADSHAIKDGANLRQDRGRDLRTADGHAVRKGTSPSENEEIPDLEVLFGVELGLQPQLVPFSREYAASYPFDFIIGSSHVVKKQDPAFSAYFERFSTEKEALMAYFEEELLCAQKFDEFDVYGHLDYAARYAPSGKDVFSYRKYADVLEEILKTLIDKGKGIEINTGGFRKSIHRSNPHPDILKRYRELGGEIITVGSDAHRVEDVAADFARAEKILREGGFTHYTLFRQRKPFFIEL